MHTRARRTGPAATPAERRLRDKIQKWSLTELRPKNHLVGRLVEFAPLCDAIAAAEQLKVLYLQSQPHLDDAALGCLASALERNRGITGVNLGELPSVTRAGWRRFIDRVPSTSLIDCYAQPAGGGPREEDCRQLKRAIIANRKRDGVARGTHAGMWRQCDYGQSGRCNFLR